ncbi:MAG: DUF1269 domain-containing protein [Fimbriimonadaceae bacterium]|nr:DUF1269 domain-containing protein [Fimbriimonadaceae bacterium]QYK54963.1 MAG: DUF1269 domain-containing protein [Fimbriimonadaceae bacterium]
MNKTLVAIFDNEDAAFNGLNALKQLHLNGDITLYDSAVVTKNSFGETSLVKAPDDAPTGTFLGMFVGALVGVLGGPIGLAVGASAGILVGATSDAFRDSVDYGFVDQVREVMIPGKVAVIADVEETWVTPVDLTISERGGIVFRRLRHEVVEDQLAREHAEFEEELKELKKEWATATGETKAKIQARITSVERSLDAARAQADARAKKLAAEWAAKREAMESQLKDANIRERARIKDQMDKAKREYEARAAKLRQAQQLVAEALRP